MIGVDGWDCVGCLDFVFKGVCTLVEDDDNRGGNSKKVIFANSRKSISEFSNLI